MEGSAEVNNSGLWQAYLSSCWIQAIRSLKGADFFAPLGITSPCLLQHHSMMIHFLKANERLVIETNEHAKIGEINSYEGGACLCAMDYVLCAVIAGLQIESPWVGWVSVRAFIEFNGFVFSCYPHLCVPVNWFGLDHWGMFKCK